jgi:hypothetical protein
MYTRMYCLCLCNKLPVHLQWASQISPWKGVKLEYVIKKITSFTMFTRIHMTLFWASLIQYLLTHNTYLFTAIEVFSCHSCRRPNKWFHNACPLHAIFHNFMIPTEFHELYKTLYSLLQFFYGFSVCHRKTPGYSVLKRTQSLFCCCWSMKSRIIKRKQTYC